MEDLTVKHYLNVYTTRKEMQKKGITNPSTEIKKFTQDLIDKLNDYSLDEKILLKDGSFFDSEGKLILTIPR